MDLLSLTGSMDLLHILMEWSMELVHGRESKDQGSMFVLSPFRYSQCFSNTLEAITKKILQLPCPYLEPWTCYTFILFSVQQYSVDSVVACCCRCRSTSDNSV